MKEKKYLAYDVILSAANIISVIKYKVIDQAVVNVKVKMNVSEIFIILVMKLL